MKIVERKIDIITGSSNLEDLYTLKKFPVFMGSVLHDPSEDLVEDMTWSISKESGFIQLKKMLPLDVLYQSQTTTSAVGETWMAHHRAFSKFIHSYSPNSVLELGGAHGILAKEYQDLANIPWTILEPNPHPVEGCKAKFIKGFFDSNFKFDGQIDMIIHSHVFEHMYEPDEFVKNLSFYMKNDQKMIFSVPNLLEWLKRKYTNCINFEHSIFLTEPYIDYLLSKHGFRIEKKQEFMNGHSIFYQVTRDNKISKIKLSEKLYDINKKIFEEFIDYHEKLITDINNEINLIAGPVYLFGAHIFSQYLIAFGLNNSRITCLLDNDKNKHGKRLYGTKLSVASPYILANDVKPTVILRAGIYNNEIKREIINKINANTVFLE